jgi:hypothetical protein
MIAVGMLMAWAGYTVTLYGYVLVRGYDIKLGDLASPFRNPPFTWPKSPVMLSPDVITPGSSPSTAAAAAAPPSSGSSGSSGGGGTPAPVTPPTRGPGGTQVL